MRVSGDIVSSLLQRHRARRAGLGVAGSRGCTGCPSREGAAGLARPKSQPRVSAQRRAHGPCADLAPGRDQGQGRLLASQDRRAQQGTGPEPRTEGTWGGRRSGTSCCLVLSSTAAVSCMLLCALK
uniref:Uncharacterized protein n=1 Tax=Oryctolagus cuniculus TaxID=9986 RepID=A0A5F9DNR4_RABIT